MVYVNRDALNALVKLSLDFDGLDQIKDSASAINQLAKSQRALNKEEQKRNEILKTTLKYTDQIDNRKTGKVSTFYKKTLVDPVNDSAVIDKEKLSKLNASHKLLSKQFDLIDKLTKIPMTSIKSAADKFGSGFEGIIGETLDVAGMIDGVDLSHVKDTVGIGSTIARTVEKLDNTDVDDSIVKLNKYVTNFVKILSSLDQVAEDLTKKVGNLGAGTNSAANGLKTLASLTEEQYKVALERDLDSQTQRTWKAYENNKAVHDQAVKDNNMWFTNMFDKSKPFMQRLKESAGMLGKDLKTTMIGGLKGLITGGIFNLFLKGLQTALKIIMTPVKSIVKMGTSFARLMVKTATGTEVFKKIIELTLLPFVLLFTLMFAPILVRLAPLLVDMVQKVTEKWDVLENIGDRIAEILTLFFDDNNWFSFGNILDSVISLLDDLTEVAYSTFKACQEAGETGLSAVVAIAASVIITFVDKIISFMYSADGMYLFFAVGEIVGLLIVEALKLAIAALAPIVVSIFGILGGIIGGVLAEIVLNVAKQLQSIWFIGGWLNDTLTGLANDIRTGTNSTTLENSMYDKLSAAGIYNKGDTKINSMTTTSYMTINNNSFKPIGNIYTGKQYAMPGM